MGKKFKKDYSLIPLVPEKEYYIYSDSGNGSEHEYTIKIQEVETGTLYSMQYADSSTWTDDLRNVNIFHLLNTGNEYVWVHTDPMNVLVDYDEMFRYQLFLRFIQDIEARGKYSVTIVEITQVSSFNF